MQEVAGTLKNKVLVVTTLLVGILGQLSLASLRGRLIASQLRTLSVTILRFRECGDAFPIEGVLVATYLLSVEALPHCRCGVANKSCMV